MDWHAHMQEVARWLVEMHRSELSREHAQFREQELMRSGLYAQLPRYVKEARNADRNRPRV